MSGPVGDEDRTSPGAGSGLTLPRILASLAGLVVFALVWFAIAGRATWLQGWLVLLVFAGYVGLLFWWLSRANPDLVRERTHEAENVEAWDRVVIRIYTALMVLLLGLAALDSGRFGWSAVPVWVQLLGWLALVAAGAIIWHVMAVNAYLSSYARLQEDRGQTVVTDGLYRYVRHPMYLGIILAFLGLPPALASWWALIPALLVAAVFVYRTAREDRMLLAGLPGYEAYAQRVRYRLLPGVW
jgi:protein-S-isoprenylcysteine O-methyltransferase Ste14